MTRQRCARATGALVLVAALGACASHSDEMTGPSPGEGAPRATTAAAPPATLSRAPAGRCANADWRRTGYRHGRSGFPASAFAMLSEACAVEGVRPDRLAYATGRLEGLQLFCAPSTGYRRGLAGTSPAHNCPHALAPAYEDAFRAGVAARRP